MGFDNECILNIQSLAGEYFCPVCRLLVYPNEALQSQCTHLYCKPCLTYVVSTTRACPYDGYLVTEADAKPLIESNKALAETIGLITVHCLYHRSGCTWEGPLSECTSHCSGCSFGNSAVVCNRCGVQIVHRQVQEHAQNCPVVQTQAHGEGTQEAAATGTTAAGENTQAATHVGTSVTQAQPSQIMASSVHGHDQNQQANPTTQSQSSVQAAVPTAEQWYQQYQQYYQQYPGYDPYQQQYQQYNPYQQPSASQHPQSQAYMQPAAAQPQPQVQSQAPLQTQPQSHLHMQQPGTQPQSQSQVNSQQQTHSTTQPQSQIQSQTHLAPLGQQHLQAPTQPLTHPVQPPVQVHMPPYQQPQSQMQHQSQVHTQNTVAQPLSQGLPQTYAQQPVQPPQQSFSSQSNQLVHPHLQPQPQSQHSSTHAVTGHHSYPQFQSQQQMQPGGPHMYPQGGIQPQSQHSVQVQNQFLQQAPPLRPPQSHVPVQNPQQSGMYPSPGQVPDAPPSQQQPAHSHVNQPGVHVPQRSVMQSVQPPSHLQYAQQQLQPFSGQALGSVQSHVHQQGAYGHQNLHVQSQLRPQGQQLSHAYQHPHQNVALPHGMQPHQTQNLGGRPMTSPNGVLAQPHPYSSVGVQGKPMQVGTGQQSGNTLMTNNPMLLSSEQHFGVTSRSLPERQGNHNLERGLEAESSSLNNNKRNPKDLDVPPGLDADANEVKKVKMESDIKPLNDENKPINEAKDASKSPAAENGVHLLKKVKDEPADGNSDQKDVSVADNKQVGLSVSEDKESHGAHLSKTHPLQEGDRIEDQSMKLQKDRDLTPQPTGGFSSYGQVHESLVPIADQRKQQPPSIPHGLTALQRPVGSSSLQAPPGSSHHMQFPGHSSAQIRPFGPGNIPHLGQPMNSLPEHLQQPSHKQPHGPEASPGIGGPGPTSNFGRGQGHYESDMFPNHRPIYADDRRLDPLGQQPGKHSSAVRMNGAPGVDSSLGHGLRDDRWRPLPEEHMNPFPQDPARRIFERGEFEEDLKHFPRTSDLDNDSGRKFGGRFLSSRPLDKGQHGRNYGSGMKLEALGGPAPSRFFPPYHHDGVMHPNEIGERPIGFNEKTAGGQPDPTRNHDFFGPVSRFDMAPRSPHRDYPGVSSHRFGALPGLDEFDGRESHRYGDLFHGNRFPVLPSHLHRGEFEGPVQEGFPSHLRRGEHHLGEPIGFDGSHGPARMGELPGPGNFFHPQLGEPGYRSNFSLKGFPGDSGNYPGDFESFDNLRRRKQSSMGWCRICKLDCETVEGLDLHSQTREHQKKAVDMVLTIKQNAKKQKIASLDDVSKSRNSSFEGSRNKN
ncbi:uncharacterized protein [Euphorbia lathyris]|uniref:uncharacterized protein n=1 Tax=Euphorbia lathyris TaxID=212925 RepID=UPI0033142A62